MECLFGIMVTFLGLCLSIDCAAVDPTNPCHTMVNSTCHNHVNSNTIYCTSDGHKYHGLCAFLHAYCEQHMTILGYGASCSHPTHPPPTTPPPPTAFEEDLFKDITHGVDDLLMASLVKGIPAIKSLPIFSKQDHAHKDYLRNKDCWAFDLDLTGLSPWNSNGFNRKAGTLISPRHAVWARHYSIKLNSTIRFVDKHNNVVDRRLVTSRTVTGSGLHSFYGQDIVVGELDRDVPATIGFARVMPRNLTTFRVPYTLHLPTLSTDQEEKALVGDFSYYTSTNAGLRSPPSTSIRHQYYESKISGDSGNPTFFVIKNQLVLLFVFTSGGAGGGTSINHYFDNINQIMGLHGSKYRLTEIDVHGYSHQGHLIPSIIG